MNNWLSRYRLVKARTFNFSFFLGGGGGYFYFHGLKPLLPWPLNVLAVKVLFWEKLTAYKFYVLLLPKLNKFLLTEFLTWFRNNDIEIADSEYVMMEDDTEQFEEYEWSGQTRIRASSLVALGKKICIYLKILFYFLQLGMLKRCQSINYRINTVSVIFTTGKKNYLRLVIYCIVL